MIKKLKKLPVGVQTLDKMIKGGYLYVDKTEYIYKLVNEGVAYFLSRPRRFGKSLLVSTLEEIFKGNKELFKGLKIYDSDWKWDEHPVVRIDFSQQKSSEVEDLIKFIHAELDRIASNYDLDLQEQSYNQKFRELLFYLAKQNKVVILIDEYDKPLIDHLTDTVLAAKMRGIMKGFYGILKGMDAQLKFVLLTGVSKFSKAGVFSDLNHLNDITMDSRYSGMLGITQQELEHNFKDFINNTCEKKQLTRADFLQQMRYWYNGYCFSDECVRVYNPFSTILFFDKMSFRNYWFESGTPTFLVELMKSKNYTIAEIPIVVEEMAFSTYELENLDVIPLLFQTGYLTLKDYDPRTMLFTLDFPNMEVKNAFLAYILHAYSKKTGPIATIHQLIAALRTHDFAHFFQIMKSFFKEIPYDTHLNYEKYYQTIFYTIFQLMGLDTIVEYKLSDGKLDLIVKDNDIFIFEFKFNKTKEAALQQIKDNKYYEPWLVSGKKIYLIGVNFKDKNVEDWVVEEF